MYLQRKQDKKLQANAKNLRHHMTKEECHLWFDFLREYPVRFMRQKIVAGCIVDFYCAAAKLAIELDGSQHYEPQGLQYDAERTKSIELTGIRVIRFTNLDIWHDFATVKECIHAAVQQRLPQ